MSASIDELFTILLATGRKLLSEALRALPASTNSVVYGQACEALRVFLLELAPWDSKTGDLSTVTPLMRATAAHHGIFAVMAIDSRRHDEFDPITQLLFIRFRTIINDICEAVDAAGDWFHSTKPYTRTVPVPFEEKAAALPTPVYPPRRLSMSRPPRAPIAPRSPSRRPISVYMRRVTFGTMSDTSPPFDRTAVTSDPVPEPVEGLAVNARYFEMFAKLPTPFDTVYVC